jgi:transposase InsO family protein
MLSQLTTFVQVFDGQNYVTWCKAMCAFLMAQGLWGFTNGSLPEPLIPILPIAPLPLDPSASQADQNAHAAMEAQYKVDKADFDRDSPLHPALWTTWHKGNDMALGNITLCLSPAIQQRMNPNFNAEQSWDWLKTEFGGASFPSIYCNFREAITMCINPSHHPGPQFDKVEAAFTRIANTTIGKGSKIKRLSLPSHFQALIAMAAIPLKWENLIPIIQNGYEIEDVTFGDIRDIVVTQFENETNHGAHLKNKKEQHANKLAADKLSAVKHKCNNPHFKKQSGSQQQDADSSPPNQQQHKQRGARAGGHGKAKGKGKAQTGHSHVASVAALTPALPSPSTTSVAHIGPSSSIVKCTVSIPHPTLQARVEGPYPTINRALSLLERMDAPLSIQVVKTIEQRFDDYDQSVQSRSNYNYDKEYDSEVDVDMSQPVPKHDNMLTETDFEDDGGTSLVSAFESLSVDLNSQISGGITRAPTPEYVDPETVGPLHSEDEIAAMWANPGHSRAVQRRSSNEFIDELYRNHQQYIQKLEFGAMASTPASRCATPGHIANSLLEDELLDWGSDDEEYTLYSLTAHDADFDIVSARSRKKQEERQCNNMLSSVVSKLYSINLGVLDILKCKHDDFFTQCARCNKRLETLWLLDSGASVHFTNRKSDFISYKPYPKSDRQPVRTAAHTIFVEGSGTVLLRHYVNKTLVMTRVHPVLYIPSMSICLLSMGEFLQQGMCILGNLLHITLLHQKPFVQCKPLIPGHMLYWLDATSTSVEVQFIETPYIYKVDYDLMHRRLGHPSKEVLRHAKDHTKGFPDGIKIPNTSDDVCPGCVQGKMPSASHPPSTTRATTPFRRIHSDLKSFPLLSYAKYKYFIVFLDDYTSYAWITLLRDKGSAITALRQWLALIKNQFDTTIKEWMSDASSEYKSDVFLKTLKYAGITVLQSTPHMPQQNGRAERIMHTIMDKAQAMWLEACLPQSWWEFAVNHAAHCYNRTPMSRINWKTPYQLLNNEIPDISHLRVFGCGAYVHIPESRRKNKLSPKSELMIYLGRPSRMKGDMLMHTPNTLFYSDKALFDEILFPRCSNQQTPGKICGTTQLDEPPSNQPPLDFEDTTPGDLDLSPPEPPKGSSAPQPDGVEEVPAKADDPPEQQAPPPRPDPVPKPKGKSRSRPETTSDVAPRRSERLRKVPTNPDNIYGDRHPSKVSRDIEWTCTWKQMVENQLGSSRQRSSHDQTESGKSPEQSASKNPTTLSESSHDSEDEVDQQLLTRLAQEGGVKFQDYLLAKAVPLYDLGSPDTSNIREWTFRDILRMPKESQEEWKQVCREELASLRKCKVFELVDPPKGRKVIKNRWVFNLKSDGRKKARLVAKGFSQVEGIDYDEIFSPVVQFETVRMMIALAALKDWHISGLDVKTAFLYGDLDEELYMEQPEGFKVPGHKNKNKVMRLKKAIYGLKQAALAWWKALDGSMAKIGCTRLVSDSGIFVNKGKTIVIIIYVDNVLFLGANKKDISSLKEHFMQIWECRDLGDTQEFLCMCIVKSKGHILIDQVDYLYKVLQRFKLINAKTVPTPLPEGYQPLPNKDPPNPELCSQFQQVIGSLLYIMIGTQPDIAYAVTKLSQFAANPNKDHLDRAMYICHYLLGTSDYALVYDGKSDGGLLAYADSDWASDPITRKSTTGYLVKLANGVFCWNSRVQKSIVLSSTEAEYMLLADTSRQLVWIRSLFEEIGIILAPIPLCSDNQGSIFLASNPVQEKCIKHIDIRYHYIREVIRAKKIELFFIEGSENPADLFTKNLGRIKFQKFREQLGLEFYSS